MVSQVKIMVRTVAIMVLHGVTSNGHNGMVAIIVSEVTVIVLSVMLIIL
jgi:hypothetical protein